MHCTGAKTTWRTEVFILPRMFTSLSTSLGSSAPGTQGPIPHPLLVHLAHQDWAQSQARTSHASHTYVSHLTYSALLSPRSRARSRCQVTWRSNVESRAERAEQRAERAESKSRADSR